LVNGKVVPPKLGGPVKKAHNYKTPKYEKCRTWLNLGERRGRLKQNNILFLLMNQ